MLCFTASFMSLNCDSDIILRFFGRSSDKLPYLPPEPLHVGHLSRRVFGLPHPPHLRTFLFDRRRRGTSGASSRTEASLPLPIRMPSNSALIALRRRIHPKLRPTSRPTRRKATANTPVAGSSGSRRKPRRSRSLAWRAKMRTALAKEKNRSITSERGYLLAYFHMNVNAERTGTKYKPLPIGAIAAKLRGLELHDLYWLQSVCESERRRGVPGGKVSWGSLKIRASDV